MTGAVPPDGPGDPEEALQPPPSPRSRARRGIRSLAVDVSPLRTSRDFRLLWTGMLISETGHQITRVAIYIQVFLLTGSAAAVGLVGLVEFIPLTLASIGGQSIVDALDRRKIILVTQIGFVLSSSILMASAIHGDPPLWVVYAAAGLTAGLGAVDSPTRSAMVPRLVGRAQVPAAIALNQVMWNTTMIVGPALGGLIIGAFSSQDTGLAWAYGIDVVTYGATIAAALMMRPMPPLTRRRTTSGLAAIKAGFAYLKGRRVLQSTFVADLIAMIFGMPRALFPILAITQFGADPSQGAVVVGVLTSAIAVGALLGALTAGWVGRVKHQGQAVVWAIVTWGASIVGFGLSGGNLWLAILFLAVAGAADVVSAVFRSSILQLSVPDELRGRLSAIHILVVTGGPRIGDVEAGLVAQAFTPTISVVTGGLACMAGVGLLAVLVPAFWRYHAGSET